MNPLYNPLKTCPIQTGRKMSMEPYPNRQFGFNDDPDRQSGSGSVPTCTRTRSDGPDPLLTLTPSTVCTKHSILRVQHTLSTAYPDFCIHHVMHHPNTNCLPLPASFSSLGRPCCTQFSIFPWLQVNHWFESQFLWPLPPKLPPPDWPPPNTAQISPDHGLQVHVQTCSITILECISKFTRSRHLSVSPHLHNYGLEVRPITAFQVHLQTSLIAASECISKLARLRHPSVSPNLLYHGLQVYLQTHSVMASKIAQSWPPRTSPVLLDHGPRVHLYDHLIMVWWNTRAEGRQPIINTPLHLACHSKRILEKEWFWLNKHRKRVRGYEGIPGQDEPHKFRGSVNAWHKSVRIHTNCGDLQKLGKGASNQELG